MSLHLISMLIHAPEKVRSPMNVQHDPPSLISSPLPLLVVISHLDPFRLEFCLLPPPLPPRLPANFVDAFVA